jgi:hypothetical protein
MKNVLQIATADSLLELLAQHYEDLDCPNQFIPFTQKRIASIVVSPKADALLRIPVGSFGIGNTID